MKDGTQYKRGNQVSTLTRTMTEGRGPSYKWREVLALLNEKGQWQYTKCWKSFTDGRVNMTAHKDILRLGYKLA